MAHDFLHSLVIQSCTNEREILKGVKLKNYVLNCDSECIRASDSLKSLLHAVRT